MGLTRKSSRRTPLRRSYGEVLLQKGTILYHSSYTPIVSNPLKPMLFTTFHPSDWHGKYVSEIRLKKDVSLFFMVDTFVNVRVLPLLQKLVLPQGNNLVKMYDTKLKCFVDHLKEEHFHGWLSTIEGGTTIEVSLLNSPEIFEIVSCEKSTENWSDSYYNTEDKLVEKNFGKRYAIGTMTMPAKFILNSRYKSILEEYRTNAERINPNGFTLSIVLSNASITYFEAQKKLITWNCEKHV